MLTRFPLRAPLRASLLAGLAAGALLSACSDEPAQPAQAPATVNATANATGLATGETPAAPPANATAAEPAPPPALPAAALPAQGQAINDAAFAPPAAPSPAGRRGKGGASAKAMPEPMLIKAQVMLARANFSPGEVDGLTGSNFRHAIAAYAKANGLQSEGDLTQEVWDKLAAAGGAPAATSYTLTQADVSGPWSPDTHDDIAQAKGLDRLGFTHATEALGERFHVSEDLLKTLNPDVDFTRAGVAIVVPDVGQTSLAAVDHIEVDKSKAGVFAFDASGKLVGAFPATVGSVDRPSPSGEHKVQGVARDPDYVYDPKKLTWGPKALGRFVVKPGPNNPVGAVWIDLDAPSYGLHGAPEPHQIGKTASHGCVRMTNWDALLLASAVKSGVKVSFLNRRGG